MTGAPTSSDSVEVEWQFDAIDLEAVDHWLRSQPAHAVLRFVPRPERIQVDDYFDTADWSVLRGGFTLRVRRRDESSEATLKATTAVSSGPRRRREVNERLEPGMASPLDGTGPVGGLVREIVGSRPLRKLCTIRTRRRLFDVVDDGTTVAEIALDETTVVGVSGDTIRRVEVEEVSGGFVGTPPFIVALVAECALVPATGSKFEAGLRAAGLSPDAALDFGPTELDAELSADAYAYAVLRTHFIAFLRREPGTRLGEDAEELHQMRVATRRLRATLSVFRAVLPAPVLALSAEFRWIASGLGAVRDLDVQLEDLVRSQQGAEWEAGNALQPIISLVREARVAARADLHAALDSARFDALVRTTGEMLRLGEPIAGGESVPTRAFAPSVVGARFRRLRRDAEPLGDASPAVAYHAVRIRAKRMRYALEAFVPVYRRPALRMLSALRAAQDLLGEHQDANVATDWLRALVRERGAELPPDTLVSIGEMLVHHAQRARDRRSAWPTAYRRLVRGWAPLRTRMREMIPAEEPVDVPDAVDSGAAQDAADAVSEPGRSLVVSASMPPMLRPRATRVRVPDRPRWWPRALWPQ